MARQHPRPPCSALRRRRPDGGLRSELNFAIATIDELKAGSPRPGRRPSRAPLAESAKRSISAESEKNNERVTEASRDPRLATRTNNPGATSRDAPRSPAARQAESDVKEIPVRDARHGFDDAPQRWRARPRRKFKELTPAFTKSSATRSTSCQGRLAVRAPPRSTRPRRAARGDGQGRARVRALPSSYMHSQGLMVPVNASSPGARRRRRAASLCSPPTSAERKRGFCATLGASVWPVAT